ncbi:MAG TPA: hypothetical protein VGR53_10015 [Nitrososphaerales archaeon]|nr:hypothetical protein [Nitrososphaerales archaeon]
MKRVGFQYLPSNQRFHASDEGKNMLAELVHGSENFHPFETQVEVYMLALAVGISSHEEFEEKFEQTLFVLETYMNYDEYGVYPLIVKSIHPEFEPVDIGKAIDKFAAAGVRTLHKEFKNTGKIDFERLITLFRKEQPS